MRSSLSVIALCFALHAPHAYSQSPQKPRIVFGPFSSVDTREELRWITDAFESGLRDRGLEPGKNVSIEYPILPTGANPSDALRSLEQSGVSAFIGMGNQWVQKIRNATQSAPIVGICLSDAVRVGLARSMSQPGGRITGTSCDADVEIEAKNLELLLDLLAGASRIGGIWNDGDAHSAPYIPPLKAAASRRRVQLIHASAAAPGAFQAAVQEIKKAGATGIVVVGDPLIWTHRRSLAEAASTAGLPTMWGFSEGPEAGGLISYGPTTLDIVRGAANHAAKIAAGARPGDLPIEQPTKFEMVINLKTAESLRLAVPQRLLARADRIIR